MVFRKFLMKEQVGFVIGYTDAFVIDNFVKVSALILRKKLCSFVKNGTDSTP
jgi:hypothetical protein